MRKVFKDRNIAKLVKNIAELTRPSEDASSFEDSTRSKRGYHDVMQVCLNGHQITGSYNKYPDTRKEFCDKCGEKTITRCLNCENPIPGTFHQEGVLGPSPPVPVYCENCGQPYPWTKRKIKTKKTTQEISDPLEKIERICSRFHFVAKQLEERHDSRPPLRIRDEYDVQDLLHALLKIYFDDIRPEEYTPSYAGSSSRMDFLLKKEKIAVEVKKTRDSLSLKEIGNELFIDIKRYKNHPDCEVLFCLVYDPEGRITNPYGLESDLSEENENIRVIVRIVPKGY